MSIASAEYVGPAERRDEYVQAVTADLLRRMPCAASLRVLVRSDDGASLKEGRPMVKVFGYVEAA